MSGQRYFSSKLKRFSNKKVQQIYLLLLNKTIEQIKNSIKLLVKTIIFNETTNYLLTTRFTETNSNFITFW